MNVYTYYYPVPDLDSEKELTMLDFWRRSWAARGWTPVVLSRNHAKEHPEFQKYYNKVSQLPTINPKLYELSCFLRWLAIVQVGGGFMTDYDCINYSFLPPPSFGPLTSYDPNGKPGMMSGNSDEFGRAVRWMINCEWTNDDREGGKPHISDMHCLERHKAEYLIDPICVEFQGGGWESAQVVHYSSGQVDRVGIDRLEKWKAFRYRPLTA